MNFSRRSSTPSNPAPKVALQRRQRTAPVNSFYPSLQFYTPVDPFKASISFSLNNVAMLSNRGHQADRKLEAYLEEDDSEDEEEERSSGMAGEEAIEDGRTSRYRPAQENGRLSQAPSAAHPQGVRSAYSHSESISQATRKVKHVPQEKEYHPNPIDHRIYVPYLPEYEYTHNLRPRPFGNRYSSPKIGYGHRQPKSGTLPAGVGADEQQSDQSEAEDFEPEIKNGYRNKGRKKFSDPATLVTSQISKTANGSKRNGRGNSKAPSSLSPPTPPPSLSSISPPSSREYILAFIFDAIPRIVYLNFLLRLPSLYYERVTRIFIEAEMSKPMIKKCILDRAGARAEIGIAMGAVGLDLGVEGMRYDPHLAQALQAELHNGTGKNLWTGMVVEPPAESMYYTNLETNWNAFIDSLLKEWKTFNIVSVLLLTAILTILQIESAASDPLTRYAALLSMLCALMSLFYGCIYIIRFGTMRKTHKAYEWAKEAQKSKMSILWNVWILLAMPATWLAWSMVLYITTIMSFVWRTSPFYPSPTPSQTPSSIQDLIPRLIITLFLFLGVAYSVLIGLTLRRWGEKMDKRWNRRIAEWVAEHISKGGDDFEDTYGEGQDADNCEISDNAFLDGTDEFADAEETLRDINEKVLEGCLHSISKRSAAAPQDPETSRSAHVGTITNGQDALQDRNVPLEELKKKGYKAGRVLPEDIKQDRNSPSNSTDVIIKVEEEEDYKPDLPEAQPELDIKVLKLIGLSDDDPFIKPYQEDLEECQLNPEALGREDLQVLQEDILSAYSRFRSSKSTISTGIPTAIDTDMAFILKKFNARLRDRGIEGEIAVCEETGVPWTGHAVYFFAGINEKLLHQAYQERKMPNESEPVILFHPGATFNNPETEIEIELHARGKIIHRKITFFLSQDEIPKGLRVLGRKDSMVGKDEGWAPAKAI